MDLSLFKRLGLTEKQVEVYLTLLKLGPASVTKIANFCSLKRTTVYDYLKLLKQSDLVECYLKNNRQYYVAQQPKKILSILKQREKELQDLEKELSEQVIPELEALKEKLADKPIVRYFSKNEVKNILLDVLNTCEKNNEKEYRIYSTENVRQYLYKNFKNFSQLRIKKQIKVKVIATGHGGKLRGLDERKKMPGQNKTMSYIIIYPGKTAYISLDNEKKLVGVIIKNYGIYEIQKNIFDVLWIRL